MAWPPGIYKEEREREREKDKERDSPQSLHRSPWALQGRGEGLSGVRIEGGYMMRPPVREYEVYYGKIEQMLRMQQSGFEGVIEAAVSKLQEAVDGTMQSMEVRVRVRVGLRVCVCECECECE